MEIIDRNCQFYVYKIDNYGCGNYIDQLDFYLNSKNIFEKFCMRNTSCEMQCMMLNACWYYACCMMHYAWCMMHDATPRIILFLVLSLPTKLQCPALPELVHDA